MGFTWRKNTGRRNYIGRDYMQGNYAEVGYIQRRDYLGRKLQGGKTHEKWITQKENYMGRGRDRPWLHIECTT